MTAWWRAVALGALVLVAGCGTTADPSEGARTDETTLGTDVRPLDPSGSEIPGTDQTAGRQEPTINLGTARLDGSAGDDKPWPLFKLYLDDRTEVGCRLFTWDDETSVPVTVVDIVFSNDTVRLAAAGERCRTDKPACRGFTFPPSTGSEAARENVCAASVIATASVGRVQTTVRTTVTFIVRTTCTAATAKPCDDRRVAAAQPSRGNPVGVEWRYSEILTTVTNPCNRPTRAEDPCPVTSAPDSSTQESATQKSSTPPASSVPPAPPSPPSSR